MGKKKPPKKPQHQSVLTKQIIADFKEQQRKRAAARRSKIELLAMKRINPTPKSLTVDELAFLVSGHCKKTPGLRSATIKRIDHLGKMYVALVYEYFQKEYAANRYKTIKCTQDFVGQLHASILASGDQSSSRFG